MKLNVKLMLMAVALAVPLIAITVIFIYMTQNTLRLQMRERNAELSAHLADKTDAFYEDFEKHISAFLYNYGAADFKSSDMENYLKPIMSQYEYFRIMTVLDSKGRATAQLASPEQISPDDVLRHTKLIPVKSVAGNRRSFYSEVYRDKRTGALLRTAAFPFPDGRRVLGVEIDLAPLQKIISATSFGRGGSALLLDERGRIIAGPHVGKSPGHAALKTHKLRNRLRRNMSGVVEYRDRHGVDMVAAMHPAHGEWFVVAQEPRRDVYYTATRMKNLVWIAILASALPAFLTGLFVVRSIIGPMQKLIRGTDEFASGNLAYRVPIESRNEMGVLAGAFNDMGRSIMEREASIERINQMGKEISSIIDRERLADTAMRALEEASPSDLAALIITTARSREPFTAVYHRGRMGDASLLSKPHLAAARDAMDKKRISLPRPGHEDVLALPLLFEDTVKGALIVAGRRGRDPYSPTEIRILEIIASSVAMSAQNIELLEDTVEKTRMEQELKTAELLQQTLFPERPPEVPGLDLAGYIESASETGGDWYGFVHEPENNRLAILIADVTGHGVPAALVTATTNSFFRTLEIFRGYTGAGQDGRFDPLSPDFMLRCLNEIILKSTRGRLVMTLFAAVYYHEDKRLVYANAGHNMPLHCRPGGFPAPAGNESVKIKALLSRGVRLGDEKDVSFKERSISLEPDDTLLFYTDGIIECENEQGEEFGEARLEQLFTDVAQGSAEEIADALAVRTSRFFGQAPRRDDISFVVARVAAEQPAAQPTPQRTLRIPSALVVNDDARLVENISAFLEEHGAHVARHAQAAAALETCRGQRPDFCVLPLGGEPEQVALARAVKESCPDTHMVFVSSVPLEHLVPLIMEMKLPAQVVRRDSAACAHMLKCMAAKLFDEPFWGIAQYLAPGAEVQTLKIRETGRRLIRAEPFFEFAVKSGLDEYELNHIRNVADELLMNAMYDAPRDERGRFKYTALPRSQNIRLAEHEAPTLEYGRDGDFLALGVSDPFGALNTQTVLDYLEQCIYKKEQPFPQKPGGAGLGLYKLFHAVDHLIFNVAPKKKTEVICLMKRKSDVQFKPREIESLSFFFRRL